MGSIHFPFTFLCWPAGTKWCRQIGLLVAIILLSLPLAAQEASASPVFPAERHEELREELVYEPPEEEDLPEEATDPWDFNWDLELSPTTSIILLLVLLIPLGFLIYRMLGDIEGRKRAREKTADTPLSIENIEEEKMVATGVAPSLLQQAEESGRYELAIRLLYIQLLKELQDAGHIKYRRDHSNRDYRLQLRGNKLLSSFRTVTADYERYWYGEYPVDRLTYRMVYQRFVGLNAAIQESVKRNVHA